MEDFSSCLFVNVKFWGQQTGVTTDLVTLWVLCVVVLLDRMFVGKAAILFVSSAFWNRSWMWAVVKVLARLLSEDFFVCHVWSTFSVVMTEKLFMASLCSHLTTHVQGMKELLVASFAFPSPARSDHSSCDNQGTRGRMKCWDSKWWMRICGSTLGCCYYLCQLRRLRFCLVILLWYWTIFSGE